MATEEQEVLIVFSKEQLLKNKDLYTKLGEPLPKRYVYVSGKPKQFTDILPDEDRIVFNDTKIITTGKLSKLKIVEK